MKAKRAVEQHIVLGESELTRVETLELLYKQNPYNYIGEYYNKYYYDKYNNCNNKQSGLCVWAQENLNCKKRWIYKH